MRFSAVLLAVAAGLAACSQPPVPTAPGPAAGPAVTGLSIAGLPDPIIFDVPPALAAGTSYPVTVRASLDDGTTAEVKAVAIVWTSSDPSVVSAAGGDVQAHREGSATLTFGLSGGTVTATRELTVYTRGAIVREQRADYFECYTKRTCPYEFCPQFGPYWLFPVHESGTITIEAVRNPGWGGASNYVTQLNRDGKWVRSWLLALNNKEHLSATVPGGYMYVFHMAADVDPCGNMSATWTHPS